MKDTEKNGKKEEATGMVGDILEGLKENWWKYLLSFCAGAATMFGGAKAWEHYGTSAGSEEPKEEEAPDQWEGPADISE